MSSFGGPWSEQKLNCLGDYIRAYLKVMKKQNLTLYYIDAFAGRGSQKLKTVQSQDKSESLFGDDDEAADAEGFLMGTALRALEASSNYERSFDKFIFIDNHRPSCDELEASVVSRFPILSRKMEVKPGDANRILEKQLGKIRWKFARALVILDPWGLEVEWSLIERLSKTGACDVWYLFPLGGVRRLLVSSGNMPDTWARALDRVFGTSDWRERFFHKGPQKKLFSEPEDMLCTATVERVVDYFLGRLRSVFPVVSNHAILRNRKNVPLFMLVLGISSTSKKAQDAALRIANHLVSELNQ